MEVGTKVQIGRKGLMSTGWVGVVTKIEGHLRVVQFPNRQNPLKYNVHSLKRVPVEPAKPKEERFEFKEVRRMVLKKTGVHEIVYKDGANLLRKRLMLAEDSIDNINESIEIGRDKHIKFKDIVYILRPMDKLKFKRPQVNVFPFYVFDNDEIEITALNFKERDGKYDLIQVRGYEMLIEWLVNEADIKPNFVVEQVRMLKEGMQLGEDEFLNAVIPKLITETKQARTQRNCFGIILRDKKTGDPLVKSAHGRPCHARLNSMAREHNNGQYELVSAVQYICSSLFEFKLRDEWLMYVMNESPWARYCITKTMEEALESGIRVRTDIPCNAMMCTFYALRYPTEYPDKIKAWKDYCDAGMNKAIAFFAAETDLFKSNTSGHHQLLDTWSMDLDSLIKFGKCEVGGNIEEDYNKCRRYNNVSVHHGCKKLKDNHRDNGTAIEALHKLDIFGDGEVAGGAFGGGGGRKVSLEKAIEVTNNLLQG